MVILERNGKLSFRRRLPKSLEACLEQTENRALPVALRLRIRLALPRIATLLGAIGLAYAVFAAWSGS